jgi:hypothetical protein
MNAVSTGRRPADAAVSAPFFLRGELVEGRDATHRSRDLGVTFATPRIALDRVVHPRTEVPPLLNVPLAEIIDFLVETGLACVASRFIFVEADHHDADRFCERLHARIVERAAASGDARPLEEDLRDQIDMLMMLDDEFRVWGKTDGKGLVIRSDEPVDFHPINKTANVVRVDSLDDAAKYVNVATQTVGFYPFERMGDYRDRLASGGAQRVVRLGQAGPSTIGNPHDAMYPLHRFVHWMTHEDGVGPR